MADQNNQHNYPSSSKRPRLMDQPINFNYQLPTAPFSNGQQYFVTNIPPSPTCYSLVPQMQFLEGGAPRINHNNPLPDQSLGNGDDYFGSFPLSYRFHPTDDELLRCYLIPKVLRQPLPINKILEVNLCDHNPAILTATYTAAYENCGESHWYFFTPRRQKYPNGKRPSRSAFDGFWKASGTDKGVTDNASGKLLGYKKVLDYYKGDSRRNERTEWFMHEFRVSEEVKRAIPRSSNASDPMLLDEWVLCRIFRNPKKEDDMNGSRALDDPNLKVKPQLQLLQKLHQ